MPFWLNQFKAESFADDPDRILSYSQFGEDQILWTILQIKKRLVKGGFFVDVGCHHPRRYSNTYLFYKCYGWRGINIDPNPDLREAFAQIRPDDTLITCAVSDVEAETAYFRFNHPGINTIDPEHARKHERHPAYTLKETITVPTRRLDSILAEDKRSDGGIDVMNVDVEGMELEVLGSNDWSRFRPLVLCIEDHHLDLNKVSASKTYEFLREQGYSLIDRAVASAFYLRDGS